MNKHPIYGTTLYIGEFPIDTIYGTFRAITYQDLINKGYIIALVYGSFDNVECIYTRLHSSCVTSETIGSLDCDCVQQMEGALKKISEKENGIFFYLIQEGRGCGYVGKSRACMLVQYEEEKKTGLDTFGAYQQLGMQLDYRDYRNVKDICHLLNIEERNFVLLTNNPDKIRSFQDLNLKISRVESIEVTPNPFNIEYLKSKKNYGHILYEIKNKQASERLYIPYARVEPFVPYALKNLRRFVHVSSYFLPIKPVDNEILLNKEQFESFAPTLKASDTSKIVLEYAANDHYVLKIKDEQIISNNKSFLAKPYWFKVNVYYDIASFQDFIVLTYGDLSGVVKDANDVDSTSTSTVPVVRIHSESISNRFPLKNGKYKNRFVKTIKAIVRRGCGLIVLFYNDGRGSGLGHFVLNKSLDDGSENAGIKEDARDYDAACQLIKHYVAGVNIDLLCGRTSWHYLEPFLKKYSICVRNFYDPVLNLEEIIGNDFGFEDIEKRLESIDSEFMNSKGYLTKWQEFFLNLSPSEKIVTTGIGNSESHAIYLSYINPTIRFFPFEQMLQEKCEFDRLILFSQGLTPNVELLTKLYDFKRTVCVTSVSEKHSSADRRARYEKFKAMGAQFLNFQEELLDTTLIRVIGPVLVYWYIYKTYRSTVTTTKDSASRFSLESLIKPSEECLIKFDKSKSFVIVVPSKVMPLCGNLRSKFVEGLFSSEVVITDVINFVHGPFQYAMKNNSNVIIWARNNNYLDDILEKSGLSYELIEFDDVDSVIIKMEIFFSYLVYYLIVKNNVNQKEWPGKRLQQIVYEKN